MRSLQEAFDLFCRAQEVTLAWRTTNENLWLGVLRPYGKAGVRALVRLAMGAWPYRPRLPQAVCTAEEFICPPVDPIDAWRDAVREARRPGPLPGDLHPAVAGVLDYVGVERLRAGENPHFLKQEIERYVVRYNAIPFPKRAVLEGRYTESAIAKLPSTEPWLGA